MFTPLVIDRIREQPVIRFVLILLLNYAFSTARSTHPSGFPEHFRLFSILSGSSLHMVLAGPPQAGTITLTDEATKEGHFYLSSCYTSAPGRPRRYFWFAAIRQGQQNDLASLLLLSKFNSVNIPFSFVLSTVLF